MEDKSKYTLFISALVIGTLLIVYGIQIYMDTRPRLIDSNEIKITEAQGNKENEKIITVNVDDERVVFYSFDGGKNFQSENSYAISENKQITIVLKDNDKRKVGSIKYKVKVYEDEGPTIILNDLPSEIYVGERINFLKYVTALDSNQINCIVTVNDSNFNYNQVGTYKITYTATSSTNLTSTITTEIKVINRPTYVAPNPTTPKKTTYYRYRTKTVSNYECNYFECDYLDDNDVKDLIYSFTRDSYCCFNNNCMKENPKVDICLFNTDGNCTEGESFAERYEVIGNSCYDKKPLYVLNENNEQVLKTECDHDEILISGYCHSIDTYGSLTCPEGYVKKDDTCYKLIKKTCNKTCNTETWSKWSGWQTTKVLADDKTEVETKEE